MARAGGDRGILGSAVAARDQVLSQLLYLGQRLSSSGTGGERRSERGSTLSSVESEALFRVIEGEVIPRLMLAHQGAGEAPDLRLDVDPRRVLSYEDHERFLYVLMHDSEDEVRRAVHGLLARGIARETIFVELLGGAARRLGELWEEDLCDFTDVTIGLCRLHAILREESDSFQRSVDHRGAASGDAPRILLATSSGDQHIFGVVLVAEFFRREGWQVWSEPGAQPDHIAGLLARRDFEAIGLSVACSTLVEDVVSEIKLFRKASRNKQIKVMVGGRLFVESPELVGHVDADATSSDARNAPRVANGLIGRGETLQPDC